jgi:hypothetical protein
VRKRRWTEEDQEAQDRDDEWGKGCLRETAGNASGCLVPVILICAGLWAIWG